VLRSPEGPAFLPPSPRTTFCCTLFGHSRLPSSCPQVLRSPEGAREAAARGALLEAAITAWHSMAQHGTA
jgi:hypothetical protein